MAELFAALRAHKHSRGSAAAWTADPSHTAVERSHESAQRIFGLGVRARNALYDRGLARSQRLAGPVVSVGNLSVGGSGKTPFVLLLGELLKARGLKFDILSRGYGRKSRGVALVDPAGSPHDFGDEPLLMARRLNVPVIVGEIRYAAGVFAEQKFGPQLHLLDDGFQHRSLARDFDIVLVTPEDARDRLFPAGRLREPLSLARRADAVVLTSGASPEAFPLDRSWSGVRVAGLLPTERPVRAGCFLRHRAAARILWRNCAPPASSRSPKPFIATTMPTPSRTSAICWTCDSAARRTALSPRKKTQSTWADISPRSAAGGGPGQDGTDRRS